jgi:integrase
MLRESSGRVLYLDDDEEKRLTTALDDDEGRTRLTMLLHTGFRRSELLGLRWREVDFKAGVLTVAEVEERDARHAPMTSIVRALLTQRARLLDDTTLVFPNGEGNRDYRRAEKTFPAAVDAARIEDFRLHDTRHTFARRLAMEGVELLTIKALGGWKSLRCVFRPS